MNVIGKLQTELNKKQSVIDRQAGKIKRLEAARDKAQKLADSRQKMLNRLDARGGIWRINQLGQAIHKRDGIIAELKDTPEKSPAGSVG